MAGVARRPSALRAAALTALGLVLCRSLVAFVAPQSAAAAPRASVARAAGFGDEVEKPAAKKRSAVPQAELQKDHGEKWESVDMVFSGQRADSPETIMRARYTALRCKDPNFLASTERDDKMNLKERADGWAETLGLKESNFFENLMKGGGGDSESLRDPIAFEVVSADDSTVEFKIRCANGKTLYEKSIFKQDKKWGYVFSGDSTFAKWEE